MGFNFGNVNPVLAQLRTTMPQDSITPTPDQAAGNSQAVNSLSDWNSLRGMNGSPAGIGKIEVNPEKGTVTIRDMTNNILQEILSKARGHDEMLAGFAQEQQRIQAEARSKQSGPGALINVLTTFAGNLAASPGMNPMVQALGKTALAVNPTADMLWKQAQDMALSSEPIRRGQTELYKAAGDMVAKVQAEEDRKIMQEMAARKERAANIEKAYSDIEQAISKGTGNFDVMSAVNRLAGAGADVEEIKQRLMTLRDLAVNQGMTFAATQLENAMKDKRFHEALVNTVSQQTTMMNRTSYDAARRDYEQNFGLKEKEKEAIAASFSTLTMLGRLRDAFQKAGGQTGPAWGRVLSAYPWHSGELEALKTLAAKAKLEGVGGRLGSGISDNDVKLIESIIPGAKLTGPQFKAVADVLQFTSLDRLFNYMNVSPDWNFWNAMRENFSSVQKTTKDKYGKVSVGNYGEDFDKKMAEIRKRLERGAPAIFGPNRYQWADIEFGGLGASQTPGTGRSGALTHSGYKTPDGKDIFLAPDGSPVDANGNPIPKAKGKK